MLSGDLLRAQLRAGRVIPRFLDGDSDSARLLASRLREIFELAVGHTVGDLEAAIEALAAEHPEPVLVKGMAKLLHDLSTVETAATLEPSAIRASRSASEGILSTGSKGSIRASASSIGLGPAMRASAIRSTRDVAIALLLSWAPWPSRAV